LATRLDIEEWRELVDTYIGAVSAAIAEMGGKTLKKLGDGLMAVFGQPLAQENDAERAVRAALLIQRALVEINRMNESAGMPALAARIAIDAGPVVIDAQDDIYGAVPNIAARAQAVAEPGGVMITGRVQRQVAGLFVVEDRGDHTLKGVPEPVALYQIIRASGAGRRLGQRHLTPLIGRDEEIALLMRRWERARQGDGQLVLIVGEPGLGKSRLLEEFRKRVRDTPHTWVEWNFLQLLQNTALHPIAEWGRLRFGGADVPAAQRLGDLENSLAQVGIEPIENAALLAPLLDIHLPVGQALALAPEDFRRRQLAALISWVMAGARSQPIVLALEDLHWADPTTIDVLRAIAERGALAPLLILGTARPEFRAPWGMRSHHATISLAPLDRNQVRRMVAEVVASRSLPLDVVDSVAARSGGVPLFVEEVTRLLLERGEEEGVHEIPPTLQQSLTARLDRLGPARGVAQIGAVIGRDFSYELISAVAQMESTLLQVALDQLADADILLAQGLPPEATYRFKHSLIQDAAYENLLRSQRSVLHRRVAEALRDNAAIAALAEPELLAHHFTQAGLTETAIEWWGKAGRRSLARSALAEASAQFSRALGQIASLPATPALRREEVKLQVAQLIPLSYLKGFGAPETRAAVERARVLIETAAGLGEPPEDPLLVFSVLQGAWVANYIAFNGRLVRDLATQLLALAEKQTEIVPLMLGYRLMGTSLLWMGAISEGRAYLDRAASMYNPTEHRQLAVRFGADIGVLILSHRSMAQWLLGYPDSARADTEAALSDARELGQAATLMNALATASHAIFQSGDYSTSNTLFDELVVLAEEKDSLAWKPTGKALQGFVLTQLGRHAEAVETIEAALAVYRITGATVGMPYALAHLAYACAQLGRYEDAEHFIEEAMALVRTTDERWCEAELIRIAGVIAISSGKAREEGEEYIERALTVARQQHAKSWELRAAMSMARLWRDQGKRQEARELLASVNGWFTEGFDTRDLKEAKALLDELAS